MTVKELYKQLGELISGYGNREICIDTCPKLYEIGYIEDPDALGPRDPLTIVLGMKHI